MPSFIPTAFAAISVDIKNPLCPSDPSGCTVISILEKISGYLIILGAPILAIMIIYGAFLEVYLLNLHAYIIDSEYDFTPNDLSKIK